MINGRLDKKIALITGAAQGIGKSTAKKFAIEGAYVIIADIQKLEGEKVSKEIGNNSVYLYLDVQKELEWKSTFDTVLHQFGKIDILVNNAGITGFKEGFGLQDPEHASLDSWRQVHAINSDGVFLGCKYAIQAMKHSNGGVIINVSSRSGMVGIPGAAAYAASKAAVRNHTKSVALYCCQQGYNIRCNSVHPAAILTPMWDPILGKGHQREQAISIIAKDIPMGIMGSSDDVANAILFLASDESKYITGTEFIIDGGILAGSSASPRK